MSEETPEFLTKLDNLSLRNKMIEKLITIRDEASDSYGKGRWVTNPEGLILHSLVRLFDVNLVVESGTANGFSACYMAADNNVPVHTFDPHDRPKIWDEYKELNSEGKIVFHNKRFSEGVTSILEKAVGPSLIFIDGDHSVGNVREDWDAIVETLDDGDVIAFHDLRERAISKHWMRIKPEIGEKRHRFVELDTPRRIGVVLWNVTDY